jgi:hypothetical protein
MGIDIDITLGIHGPGATSRDEVSEDVGADSDPGKRPEGDFAQDRWSLEHSVSSSSAGLQPDLRSERSAYGKSTQDEQEAGHRSLDRARVKPAGLAPPAPAELNSISLFFKGLDNAPWLALCHESLRPAEARWEVHGPSRPFFDTGTVTKFDAMAR